MQVITPAKLASFIVTIEYYIVIKILIAGIHDMFRNKVVRRL